MGGPGNKGSWGGKLLPKEKDRISGIWLAKSLQAFVAIIIDPPEYEKVENINQALKIAAKIKKIISAALSIKISFNFLIFI